MAYVVRRKTLTKVNLAFTIYSVFAQYKGHACVASIGTFAMNVLRSVLVSQHW